MTNQNPNDDDPDAAARDEQQPQPGPRTGPWTGAGPIIRNPPNPAEPYGASPPHSRDAPRGHADQGVSHPFGQQPAPVAPPVPMAPGGTPGTAPADAAVPGEPDASAAIGRPRASGRVRWWAWALIAIAVVAVIALIAVIVL